MYLLHDKLNRPFANRAKRYERMMKAHGIHQTQTSIRDTPIPTRKRKDETRGSTSKKRKTDFLGEDANNTADDDEGLDADISKVKEEKPSIKVKSEVTASEDNAGAQFSWQHFKHDDAQESSRPEDNDIFSDYIHSSAFGTSQEQGGFEVEKSQAHRGRIEDTSNIGSENVMNESILIVD